jgi:processive 1,2-diacylglycerol beta-glucosyltransferase
LERQAETAGIAADRVASVPGMPIDPAFYDPPPQNKREELLALGLHAQKPTILVGFGGQGSVSVQQCALRLFDLGSQCNVIFLCGRHSRVRDALTSLPTPYPKVVLGFGQQPPALYYHLADVMIGKPGSMTITEAIVTRTPLLALKSQSLAFVQRGNEDWIRQSGIGEVITLDTLPMAVTRALTCHDMRQQIDKQWHQSVFDIAQRIQALANGNSNESCWAQASSHRTPVLSGSAQVSSDEAGAGAGTPSIEGGKAAA